MNRFSAIRATSLRGVALLGLFALACSSSGGGGGGVDETEITLSNAPLIAARTVAAALGGLDMGQCAGRAVGSGGCGPGSNNEDEGGGEGGGASSLKGYGGSERSRSSGSGSATREDPGIPVILCLVAGTLTTSGDVADATDFPNPGDFLTLVYDLCEDVGDDFVLDGTVSLRALGESIGLGSGFDNTFDVNFDDLELDGYQKFSSDPVPLTPDPMEPPFAASRGIETQSLLTEPITLHGDSRLHLDTIFQVGPVPLPVCALDLDDPISLLEMSGSRLEVGREGVVGFTADTLRNYSLSLIEDDTSTRDELDQDCVPFPAHSHDPTMEHPELPHDSGILLVYELEFNGLLTSTEFEGQVTFETIETFTGTDDAGIRLIGVPTPESSRFLQFPQAGMALITGADGATITLIAGVDEEDLNQIDLDVDLGEGIVTIETTWRLLLEDIPL